MVYMNSASTTPIKQEVVNIITDTLQNNWCNPNDNTYEGKEARKIIEGSRKVIADKINASPEEIIFTSGGAAANALALNGFSVASTTYEHASIMENRSVANIIEPNEDGIITTDAIKRIEYHYSFAFPEVVSIMATNNEVGTENDVETLVNYIHKHNTLAHIDATQRFPYKKIDVKYWDADMITITSGHKISCPAGIGVLYVKNGIKLNSLIYGTQEMKLFGGTENQAYIAALAKAVKMIDYDDSEYIKSLRCYFENMVKIDIPDCYIVCENSVRSPHISNICIKGCNSETLQMMLDEDAIVCSRGSSCNSYNPKPSHVLKAIGMNDDDILSCLRFSFGAYNTKEEINYVIDRLKTHVKFLREL